MRIMTAMKAAGAALLIALTSQQALAWDGITYGTIVGVDMAAEGATIYLDGYPVLCTAGRRSAHVLTSEPNYAGFVSAALAAMGQKTRVIVYTGNEGTQCHIGLLTVGNSAYG